MKFHIKNLNLALVAAIVASLCLYAWFLSTPDFDSSVDLTLLNNHTYLDQILNNSEVTTSLDNYPSTRPKTSLHLWGSSNSSYSDHELTLNETNTVLSEVINSIAASRYQNLFLTSLQVKHSEVLVELNKFSEAASVLPQHITSTNLVLRRARIVAFLRKSRGEWEEAIDELESHTHITPTSKYEAEMMISSLHMLARLYKDAGQIIESINTLKREHTLAIKWHGDDSIQARHSLCRLALTTSSRKGQTILTGLLSDDLESNEMVLGCLLMLQNRPGQDKSSIDDTAKALISSILCKSSKAELDLTTLRWADWLPPSKREKLYADVLDIQLTKFGSDSVGTAIAAMFYANMKEIADSQLNVSFKTNALSHSLDVFKSKLGAFHPITIGCIQNLAWQYGERDYWEEAIVLEKHALVLIEHSMGTAHPEYLDARIRLSYTLLMGGEIDLATVNVTSLIDNWAQSHHPDHWGFGAAYSSLAVCLHEAGRNQEALENALLAFKILEPQYHLSSPEIIQLSRIMASIYTSQGNIEAANDWVNAQGQFSELASPMRTEMLEQEVWVWKFGQRYTY